MRIGVDAKVLKNNSGITRYLTSLLNSLQATDNENDYFLFEQKPSDYRITNNKWKKVLIHSKMPGIIWQQILLPFFLKKYKIDLLWAPEQTCPIFFIGKIPVFLTIHDFASIRFPQTCQNTVVLISKLFMKQSIKKSTYLLPVSNYIENELRNRFAPIINNKKIVSVTNAAPDWKQISSYLASEREDYLFFVGNLEPRKNLISVLIALEILYKRGFKNLKLYIAGPSGWKNNDILCFIKNSVIKENIIFLGYISDYELKMHYSKCKAFIFPSIYEGFGLPILEALSLNCIVLTSKDTVMEEIAGKAAIYFNPRDPEDIAQSIRCLFEPQFLREKYLSYAKNVLETYTWEQSSEKLKLLFRDSLQQLAKSPKNSR